MDIYILAGFLRRIKPAEMNRSENLSKTKDNKPAFSENYSLAITKNERRFKGMGFQLGGLLINLGFPRIYSAFS